MRAFLTAAAAGLAALALGGCGKDETRPALERALAYMPTDAPAVVVVTTNLDATQLDTFDDRLARPLLGNRVERLVEESAGAAGLDFDDHVEPLLGNPLVVGLDSGGPAGPRPLAALRVRDREALARALGEADLQPAGRLGEAHAFRPAGGGGARLAVDGDMVVAAGDEATLRRAVARGGEGSGGLTRGRFARALEGLSGGALVRAYGDVPALLRAAGMAGLRAVPWIAALRTYGLAVTVRPREVEAEGLLAPGPPQGAAGPVPRGEAPPGLPARPDEAVAAVRQAGQAAAFALAVLRAARRPAPAALLPLAAAAAQLRGEAVASLSGDGEFALRAPVRDPGRARSALRAAGANVRLLAPGARVSPLGEGLARLSGPGLRTVYGLVGATLVAASDERRARELAGAPVARLDHAKGGLAARADLTVLGRAIQGWLGLDTGPLGEAVAWARSEPGGVRGVLEVRIRSAR